MDNHSLFHGLKRSNCRTPLGRMLGSANVKLCPDCRGQVYISGDLDENQLGDLIRSQHPLVARESMRVRNDGNLIINEILPAWWGYQRIGAVYFSVYGLWVVMMAGAWVLSLFTQGKHFH